MRPCDVAASLSALIPTRRPIYLWGSPGVGKSSLVRQAASSLNLELIDIRTTLLDPVDLRGLPKLTGDSATWCPPAFLPRDGDGVLFLDELALAPASVQGGCLQLTLDRRIGEYALPDGWSIVAASNRLEDRAGGHRLISSLSNRFVHIDLDVSHEDWQAWALSANVAAEVRAFLNYRPALLSQFDPASGARAFPTPRAWSFVSDLIHRAPAHLLLPLVAGCVGDGGAAEFVAFLKLYRELPDLDDVLSRPDAASVPREPAVLFALVGALVERCRADQAPLVGFVKYAFRLPEEFSVMALRDALALNPRLAGLPAVQKWIAQARSKGFFLNS